MRTKGSSSPYTGTTQDRINFAVMYISQGRKTTRTFDTCFEMGDGDAVYAGVMKRAKKNAALAANVGRYLTIKPELPPDPDQMNNQRAAWAGNAIAAFRTETGTDPEDAVGDLIANVMHYCDRHPEHGTFEDLLERARNHYQGETQE